MTTRSVDLPLPFDLARTAAPVWWARGRWPNVDWRDGTLYWVGRDGGEVVWRSVAQPDSQTLRIDGPADPQQDAEWCQRLLGIAAERPAFGDPVLQGLAARHEGLGMWSAGSLYEGFVSSIVGQSISVASAAVTERRLHASFHPGIDVAGRVFWPPPLPEQLAEAPTSLIRESGVTLVRAEALRQVGRMFSGDSAGFVLASASGRAEAERVLAIRGVGRWTVESALLWGVGDPDAHPSGDVALLRAARKHFPAIVTLRDLDCKAEEWRPYRAWAARLLWVDLLGHAGP